MSDYSSSQRRLLTSLVVSLLCLHLFFPAFLFSSFFFFFFFFLGFPFNNREKKPAHQTSSSSAHHRVHAEWMCPQGGLTCLVWSDHLGQLKISVWDNNSAWESKVSWGRSPHIHIRSSSLWSNYAETFSCLHFSLVINSAAGSKRLRPNSKYFRLF